MAARASLSLKYRIEPLARGVAVVAAVAAIAALLVAEDASAQSATQDTQSGTAAEHTQAHPTSSAVAAGTDHSCGLRTDGTITCWGDNILGQANAPSGTFSAVTAGGHRTCGLSTGGTVTCWGSFVVAYGSLGNVPSGTFSSVNAGENHTCGIRTDGTITCWGNLTVAPSGTFSAVAAGNEHACAVRSDGTITCWDDNLFYGARTGPRSVPSGTFSAVTAGRDHSCGIRTDGTIVCWDYFRGFDSDDPGQIDAPAGTFTSISTGISHSCAVRVDGIVACWGDDSSGETDAPSGTFSAVSAGGGHSCGLRTDGTITCWGYNYFGQTDAPSGRFNHPTGPATAGTPTGSATTDTSTGPAATGTPAASAITDTSTGPAATDTPTAGTLAGPAIEGVPGVVGELTATPLRGGGVLVDWSVPSDDGGSAIVRYEVTYSRDAMYYRGESRDAWHITKQVRVTSVFDRALRDYRQSLATSHLNVRLNPGVDYRVSVTAFNSNGSGKSAATEFKTFDVPGVPRSVQATPLQGGGVEVSWSAPSDGGSPILRYEVEYSREALHDHEEYGSRGEWNITKTVRGTSHVYNRLLAGVSYRVTVTAVNRIGSSDSRVPMVVPIVFVTRQPCPTTNKFEIKEDPWWKVFGRETRVVALQDFVTFNGIEVEAGTQGGKVSDESSLSQSGCSWIFDDAEVSDGAHVSGNAVVSGRARVYDESRVYGNARVHGDARVYGDAAVYGDASVFGDARVYGNARVHGNAKVHAKSKVRGSAELFGTASFPSVEEDTELFEAEFPGLEADAGQFDGEQEHRRAGQELYRMMRAHFTNRLIECDEQISEYTEHDIPTIVDSLLSEDRYNDIRPASEALLLVCKIVISHREVTGFFLPTWWDLIFPMAKSLGALRSLYLESLIELVQMAKSLRDLSQIPNAASMWDEFEKCDTRSC